MHRGVGGARAAKKEGAEARVHAVAVTSDGYSLRFSLEPFVEPSTRSGRRYARTAEGAEVVGVARLTGGEILIAATREARAILTKADEGNFLSGPGRGVVLIRLSPKDDRAVGFISTSGHGDRWTAKTTAARGQTTGRARDGPRAAPARPAWSEAAGRSGATVRAPWPHRRGSAAHSGHPGVVAALRSGVEHAGGGGGVPPHLLLHNRV